MASKSVESRGEIEGAKRLLRVAQDWNKNASAMLKLVQDELTTGLPSTAAVVLRAKKYLLISEKEVNEAATYVKEVEKKWEVIDVDSDNDTVPAAVSADGDGSEERKNTSNRASVPPNNRNSQNSQVIDISDSGDEAINDGSGSNISGAGRAGTGGTSEASLPHYVNVEGCGISDVNGTYIFSGIHEDAPKYTKCDSSRYAIYRDTTPAQCNTSSKEEIKRWLVTEAVASLTHELDICHYTAHNYEASNLPPPNKWKVAHGEIKLKSGKKFRSRGRFPGPKLVYQPNLGTADIRANFGGQVVNELVVEGCGSAEINGIYRLNGYYNGAPSYFKARSSDGVPSYNICQGRPTLYDSENAYWYISVLGQGQWDDCYETKQKFKGLPLNKDWVTLGGGSERIIVKLLSEAQADRNTIFVDPAGGVHNSIGGQEHQSKRARYN